VILLVTCFAADDSSGGAVILRHWVKRLNPQSVCWMALSKPSGVLGEMRKHNATVLLMSFLRSQAHLTRLNIATKMSECIASGTHFSL
jgi:hypothetical protein